MKLAKVKSVVLHKALQSKEFGMLRMYLSSLQKEGEYFITPYNPYCKEWDIRSILSDYFFNEEESESLWSFAENTIGSRRIDLILISTVEL